MTSRGLGIAILIVAFGCQPSSSTLVIDVVSDFRAGTEADSVEVRLVEPERTLSTAVTELSPLRAGLRAGSFEGLDSGSSALLVVTLRRAGAPVAERAVRVVWRDSVTVVTVVITRDCRSIVCPAEGGDPNATACLGGTCVDPRCSPEQPEFCPDLCGRGCAPPAVECADARCDFGVCLQDPVDERCGPAERCDLDRGCVTDDRVDAGIPDGAVPDAGPDADPDVGPDAPPDAVTGPLPIVGALQITVGGRPVERGFGCARLPATVLCWGDNSNGQLGTGVANAEIADTALVAVEFEGASDVSAGGAHACAVVDGVVYCVGANELGQLGDGTTTDSATRVRAIADAVAVDAGLATTCALRSDGSVWCWGADDGGQLGGGLAGTMRNTPTQVPGLPPMVAVAVGDAHVCAIGVDGRAWCWGQNGSGRLGIGMPRGVYPPTALPLADVTEIAAARNHSCAVSSIGASCFGLNNYEQLGTSGGSSNTPAAVPGLADAVSIAADWRHSCAALPDGTGRCWGARTQGRLGDGRLDSVTTPVPVMDLVSAQRIVAGPRFSCALLADGAVGCWGDRSSGATGDGEGGARAVPGPALAPDE